MEKEDINIRFIEAVNRLVNDEGIPSKGIIANLLGIKPSKLSEILNKRMNIGTDLAANICDNFNVSAEWLLTGKGNMFTDSQISKESKIESVSNSPIEESILYKMYKEKDEENKALIRENGRLEERINQLKSHHKVEQKSDQSEIIEAFTFESFGDYGESSSPTKPSTTSKRSSAGKV